MLSAEGLRHAFGEGRGQAVALDGVSFNLTAGQTLAVFGPNGAGKTTLLKVLAGLIRPQQGSVRVAGGRGAIGWIGHQSHLYEHLTVRENLLFWAALYGVPAARRSASCGVVARRGGAACSCWRRTTWTRGSSSRPMSRSNGAAASSTLRRAQGGGPPTSRRRTGGRLGARGPMGELLAQAWMVARKDLLLEFRTRTALVSAIVFTALVLTVFNF